MMRKMSLAVSLFLIGICLTACGQRKPAVETSKTPSEIAEEVIASQEDMPVFLQIADDEEEFDFYLLNYYTLDREQITGGVICYANGVEASEIAVLVFKDASYAEKAQEALSTYVERRTGDFVGYAPQQAALAKGGTVVTNGNYATLLICSDTAAAKAAFFGCFGEAGSMSPETVQTAGDNTAEQAGSPSGGADNSYNSDAVLQAWASGDTSSLSERDLAILNAAKDVIDQKIDSSMSDYEKELAIHDWLTGWSSFNMNAFSRGPGSEGWDTDTPYGVLINKSGNCWGYSSTFQLFMEMLDIECITVYGTPNASGVEHTWNMVKLDGEWYCVDTAWDDPIGGSPCHTYFNRTSEEFRNSGIHRWDESAVPEANGTTYRYGA